MYVIFPADELVYLSYDRLIYVPSSQPTSYETQIASSFSKTPPSRSTVPQPDEESTPERPRRIKRENLISSGHSSGFNFEPNEIAKPKRTASRKSKTPTKSREHSPNPITKPKISPSTSLKSSSNSSNKIPTIVTTPVSTKPQFSFAQPDPAKYINKNYQLNHLQLPSSSTSKQPRSPTSDQKRLSYSDFLPVHKCLKEEQNKKLLRPHSSPVDIDVLFKFKDAKESTINKKFVERNCVKATNVEQNEVTAIFGSQRLEARELASTG